MTQEELLKAIEINTKCGDRDKAYILDLINQHVSEVIGEDDKPETNKAIELTFCGSRNRLRADQRKRAGLEKHD